MDDRRSQTSNKQAHTRKTEEERIALPEEAMDHIALPCRNDGDR